ncbi:hypothetical protein WN943_019549 [Citrus x changshan-huyou]
MNKTLDTVKKLSIRMHKTRKISMSSLSERSAGHIICVFMLVILTSIAVIATESSSSSSPLLPSSPASSPLLHPLEDWNEGSEKHYQIEPSFGDYGTWNPTPRSGGGYSAPVPHAEKSCRTSPPSSFHSDFPFPSTASLP